MNVGAVFEGFRHRFIARDRGEQTKLDLGIVGIDQNVVFVLGDEVFAQFSSQLRADRDVLQIRLGRGKTSRCGDGLIERGMNASVLPCDLDKAVGVSGLQLCDLAVFKNVADDRMVGTQLFQHLGVGRALGGGTRQSERVKEHLSELLGGVDIEDDTRRVVDVFHVLLAHFAEHIAVCRKTVDIHAEAADLHAEQNGGKRKLDVVVQTLHTVGGDLITEHGIQTRGDGGQHTFVCAFGEDGVKILHGELGRIVVALRRIDDISCEHGVKCDARRGNACVVQRMVKLLCVVRDECSL